MEKKNDEEIGRSEEKGKMKGIDMEKEKRIKKCKWVGKKDMVSLRGKKKKIVGEIEWN